MRPARRALAVTLMAVAGGCGGGTGDASHPLAGLDPAVGFVGDAYEDVDALIGMALEQEMGNPGRLLAPSDPLGVARLALLAEVQLGTCPNGQCPEVSDADAQLSAFLDADLGAVLPTAAGAADGWAALGVAHVALALSNLLERNLALSPRDAASIAEAAGELRMRIASADAVETLDWKALLPPSLPEGTVRTTLLLHPPAPRPSKDVVAAARSLVEVVAEALGAYGDFLPFPVGATLDPAMQTLHRTPLVVDFPAFPSLGGTAVALHGAARTLASKTIARTVEESDWAAFAAAVDAWDAGIVERGALLERCRPLPFDVAGSPPLPGSRVDPNARGLVPNVPTRTGSLTPLRPYLELRTGADAPPKGAVRGTFVSPWTDSPTPAPSFRVTWVLEGPVPVRWVVHAAAPIDHVDLRIQRPGGAPFVRFLYRPDAADRIASATTFFPSTDPEAPGPDDASAAVSYRIDAVAVDRLGRFSEVASTTVFVAFVREEDFRVGDGAFTVDESGVVRFSTGDSSLVGAEAGTLAVATPYVDREGAGAVRLAPPALCALSGGVSVTFRNDDDSSHHLRSVYTPPYLDDPFSTPSGNAIGGVPALDFGVVPAGGLSTIVLPDSVPVGYRWTLFDVVDTPSTRVPAKGIFTTEPPSGPVDPPIGG